MKKRWTRILALCLAAVCLISVVAAATSDYDLTGNTVVNVWDLQLAKTQGKDADFKAGALEEALGGANELAPVSDGVYEIYSAVGLYNMAKHATEGATFKLMNDIDLQGGEWTPVANFKGIFEGQGHTISNFSITKSQGINMGFFAQIDHYKVGGQTVQSQVRALNLENASITATEAAQYIGLLAGSNRGIIENCTTTGAVTDNRTVLSVQTYIGTIAGRNNNSGPDGKVTYTEDFTGYLTATAGSSNEADLVEGLSSKLAMHYADLSYPEGTADAQKFGRQTGVAGYTTDSNISDQLIWQDISYSTSLQPQLEQDRRNKVVAEMYRMGTIQWTPSTDFYYNSGKTTNTTSNAYLTGRTYYGIPYNGGGGAYQHFLTQMQPQLDDEGRYKTVEGLEDSTKDGKTGFKLYMGNNCSSALAWAWAAASPTRLDNYGVVAGSTAQMVPNAYNNATYGVLPVGDYQLLESDSARYERGTDARDTMRIIELNGGFDAMAEYYAQTRRGDALLYVKEAYNAQTDTYSSSGHARLLAQDPVVIRKYKGAIDLDKSYFITHEQGDGLYDNRIDAAGNYEKHTDADGNTWNVKPTSWRIDRKYTFNSLLTGTPSYTGERLGCGPGYVPVTIPAYTAGTLRAPYYDDGYKEHPISLPNSGWYYSNYAMISATMTVTDTAGNELYNRQSYKLPNGGVPNSRTLKLEEMFPDSADGLTAGNQYHCTLTVLASTGEQIKVLDNQKFTYTPVQTPVEPETPEETPEEDTDDGSYDASGQS